MRSLLRTSCIHSVLSALALLFLSAGGAHAVQQQQGLCAVVKMEILQELALERIGFLATLDITNNESTASIVDFSATLSFENPSLTTPGVVNDASPLFFVQPPDLTGINSIDGTGIIRPGQTATIKWFIIPKLTAGGEAATGVRYRVGAKLAGSMFSNPIPPEMLSVYPDLITVKPDPQLDITYFQPSDVDGDDPFTPDIVESPIPFPLGVLVKNSGFGRAKAVRIVSEQPRIVENKLGLLLVAQLLGARVDDKPVKDASLTVDIGDLEPGRCRKGAWDMITSLSGEFIDVKASYTHSSELGGRDTSVIKSLNAHFLVHEVMNDQPGRDGLMDFLTDTVRNAEHIPDTLFESDCNVVPVNRLRTVTVTPLSAVSARVDAKADFENWVFVRVDDPAQAKFEVASVVRSDGKLLSPRNYWTNVRYRKPDNARLAFLNIFDFVALGDYSYTVNYAPPVQDSTAPVTTLRFSGPSAQADNKFFLTPSTQVYFTAVDQSPVGTFYRLDNTGEFLPAYPFTLSGGGQHTIEFYSKDAANNQEVTQSAKLVLSEAYPSVANLGGDTTKLFIPGDALSVRPTAASVWFDGVSTSSGLSGAAKVFKGAYAWATLDQVPSSPTASTTASIIVSGQNADFYRYKIEGGAWSAEFSANQPLALSGLAPGTVNLSVQARNGNGSYPPEADVVSASWVVGPEVGPKLEGPATPSRSPDALIGVTGADFYCYRVDDAFYRPNAVLGEPVTLTGLSEGTHKVEVLPRAGAGAACDSVAPGSQITWIVGRNYGTTPPANTLVRQVDLGAVGASRVYFAWDGRADSGAVATPGWYTVVVTLTDSLGRSSSEVRLVEVGNLIPGEALLSDAGGAGQEGLYASGRTAVWSDQRDGVWNVWVKDLSNPADNGAVLSPSLLDQKNPKTDGRYAAWEERRADGTWDIVVKELRSVNAPAPVTNTPEREERNPAVEWPWVVYQARESATAGAPWLLYAYNLLTGATAQVDPSTQNQLDPAIEGERVVWQDFRDQGAGEIYFKNLRSGEVKRITTDIHGQYHPVIADQWVVWADNRDTQLDLYGFNFLRGAEVRLTQTPEDEDFPHINGQWVIYQEDLAGPLAQNLRLLHLNNLASVQLTNEGSAKEEPAFAGGNVLWIDRNAGRGQVKSAAVPRLQPVFNNRNTVAVTATMAATQADAYTLLSLWQRIAGISEITLYKALLPTIVTETATWLGSAPSGDNFALTPGTFLWVKFANPAILDLGASGCGTVELGIGVNAFAYSCFPDRYTAYRLIRELGVAKVAAIRVLDSRTGNWRAATVVNNEVVGDDFAIEAVSVLLIEMNEAVNTWKPGG